MKKVAVALCLVVVQFLSMTPCQAQPGDPYNSNPGGTYPPANNGQGQGQPDPNGTQTPFYTMPEPNRGGYPGPGQGNAIKAQVDAATHVLAPGDVIEFMLTRVSRRPTAAGQAPEAVTRFQVRADGGVELPILGDTAVAGRTIGVLQKEIFQRLSRKLRYPSFQLGIISVAPVQVVVLGEVMRPGRYDVAPGSGVPEALALAGGFSPAADRTAVNVTTPANVSKDSRQSLKNGDVITVGLGRRVNVIGEVFRPGAYAIPRETGGPTEAIQQALGLKPTAALTRAVIFRPMTSVSIPIDLSTMTVGAPQMVNITAPAGAPDLPGNGTLPASGTAPGISTKPLPAGTVTSSRLEDGDVLIIPPRQAIVFAGNAANVVPLVGGESILDVTTHVRTPIDYSNVKIVRQGRAEPETVDLSKYFESHDTSVLVRVQDGDVVLLDAVNPNAPNMFQNLLMNPLNLLLMLRPFL